MINRAKIKYNQNLSCFEYRIVRHKHSVSEIINPYVQCSYGCTYCYCRHIRRKLRNKLGYDVRDVDIERWSNIAELLKDNPKHTHTFIGTAVDPYSLWEEQLGVTMYILKTCASYFRKVVIATKSPMILRDISILKSCHDTLVFISLPSTFSEWCCVFEPFAPSVESRIDCIERLSNNGIDVAVFMAPIIPNENDSEKNIYETFLRVKAAGAKFVIIGLAASETPGIGMSPDNNWSINMYSRIISLSESCPECPDVDKYMGNKLGPVIAQSLYFPVEKRGVGIITDLVDGSGSDSEVRHKDG